MLMPILVLFFLFDLQTSWRLTASSLTSACTWWARLFHGPSPWPTRGRSPPDLAWTPLRVSVQKLARSRCHHSSPLRKSRSARKCGWSSGFWHSLIKYARSIMNRTNLICVLLTDRRKAAVEPLTRIALPLWFSKSPKQKETTRNPPRSHSKKYQVKFDMITYHNFNARFVSGLQLKIVSAPLKITWLFWQEVWTS